MARVGEANDGAIFAERPSVPTIRKSAAPLRHHVVDALRTAIIEGRIAPGERLVERELIEMTGVSRTVIREALRQLETEGIVDIIPNKGPVVRKLTIGEAKDLYLIRSVLEGLAARMFVANHGPEDIAELQRALARTVHAYQHDSPEEILSAKNKFYDILFGGAGSETLSSMIGALHARIWRWRALGLAHPRRSPDRSNESIEGLRDILEAIERGDADAAERITRREVENAAHEVMTLLSVEA